ncbi:helix-turn-helix domain-containing protein [Streptomyces sp. ADI97-07]|uniref:helix-turn-helix domain-containing protein n=1 Tax=Streptomyces sp. ADI97-07 TaxID=1522762 RepID=UPI003217BD99
MLVDRGPTVQRDLSTATGLDKAGIMRVVDDLERKGLTTRKFRPRGQASTGSGDLTSGTRPVSSSTHSGRATGWTARRRPGAGEPELLTDLRDTARPRTSRSIRAARCGRTRSRRRWTRAVRAALTHTHRHGRGAPSPMPGPGGRPRLEKQRRPTEVSISRGVCREPAKTSSSPQAAAQTPAGTTVLRAAHRWPQLRRPQPDGQSAATGMPWAAVERPGRTPRRPRRA